jgi:N-acetyl-alpha-D-glucosaminyl L-malate synthase BshA
MKIGMVCYPSFGGSGVVATELGRALADRGHEVHFICLNKPARWDSLGEGVHLHLVEVVSYPLFDFPPYTLALACKLYEVSVQYGLDLVHVHYAIPHSASAFLAREMLGPSGPKIITTLHGTDIVLVGMDPSYKSITRFSINVSHGVTAVSDFLARITGEQFEIEKEIKVIPNFVDPEHFCRKEDPSLRSHYASPEEKVICYVSNFRALKRAPDAVRVFHRVARRIPARLLMIGNGPDHGTCVELTHKLGIQERVHFLDFVHDVSRVLSISDLFLLTSEMESFGLAVLEAMSCGLPVVATRVGGLPEVVSNGESGYLEEPGELAVMADRVLKILSDRSLAERMGREGCRLAREKFSMEDVVNRYEEYYLSVLQDGS